MRLLIAAILAGFLPTAAFAQDLCRRLYLPPGYSLDCQDLVEQGRSGIRAVIEPSSGEFSALSRLSLRRLDRLQDEQAWSDSRAWLQSQLTVDLGTITELLANLDNNPDSPLSLDQFSDAIATVVQSLRELSRWTLSGCDQRPRTELYADALRCRWGLGPLALMMQLRLIEDGADRYAIQFWTMNEKRLRHFEAIANSFHAIPQLGKDSDVE